MIDIRPIVQQAVYIQRKDTVHAMIRSGHDDRALALHHVRRPQNRTLMPLVVKHRAAVPSKHDAVRLRGRFPLGAGNRIGNGRDQRDDAQELDHSEIPLVAIPGYGAFEGGADLAGAMTEFALGF